MSLGAPETEWDPFGHPIFKDPSARALARVGVVDVGSNSVRMVVFDGAARSPAYFYNEKILCGLGRDLGETGRLYPEGRARALAALKRFRMLADRMGIPPLTCVATAAVREAEDGPEFLAEVQGETGLKLWVIDGREEARLSAQGVLLGWPEADGLVCDIGGSSMELAAVSGGRVGKRLSSPLGPLKLQSIKGGNQAIKAHVRQVLAELTAEMGDGYRRIYLVGGSWRAFARCDMERRGYPLHVLHEYRMKPKSVHATATWLRGQSLDELRARTGTSAERLSLVPVATIVLKELVRAVRPTEIAISSYGIREGMLYEKMPADVRRRDPLIEACRFSEDKDARLPGFGRTLDHFLAPIFGKIPMARARLIRAACLLHDVTWRAHPDFRAEVCFDNATRANLGGLDHRERVWLGLALLHRYKNNREGSRFGAMFDLLSASEIRDAEVVGKAMRFGAMLGGESPGRLAELNYKPRKKVLTLTLAGDQADLFSEVADARFQSLALALGAQPVVKLDAAPA